MLCPSTEKRVRVHRGISSQHNKYFSDDLACAEMEWSPLRGSECPVANGIQEEPGQPFSENVI